MKVTFYVKEEIVKDKKLMYIDRGDFTFAVEADCPSACLKLAKKRLKDRIRRAFPGGQVRSVNLTDRQRGHAVISAVAIEQGSYVVQRRG